MKTNYIDCSAEPRLKHAASGGAAVITIPADPHQFWAIDWVSWSYDAEPTDGRLAIEIGGAKVWEVDITAAGPGHIVFDKPLYEETHGKDLKVTLAAGGANGKVSIRYR